MTRSLYGEVTAKIIDAIEEGVGTCVMPWHDAASISVPANGISGRPYRGINILLLWLAARQRGFASGRWATYRQWAAQGFQVRQGERATTVLLWKPAAQTIGDDSASTDASARVLARSFRVFNIAQTNADPLIHEKLSECERIAAAEQFFAAQPARIWDGSDVAFYDPLDDSISMPSFGRFVSAKAYYSVLAHELTHWAGAKPRLNRDLSGRFGSAAYAMEELIAELGAAFIGAKLGLPSEPRTDHAPYIASWLRVLRADPRAIFTAAGKAQEAADYLMQLGGLTHGSEERPMSVDTPYGAAV